MRRPRVSRVLGALLLVLGLPCCGVGTGMLWMVELPWQLATGWIRFLARVVPAIEVRPEAVVEGLVALVLLAGGTHWFLSWLASARSRPWSLGRSLGALAGVLGLFLTSIASAGLAHQVGWLLTSPEPLTRSTWDVREREAGSALGQLCGAALPGDTAVELRARLQEPTFRERFRSLHVVVEDASAPGEPPRLLAFPRDSYGLDNLGAVRCALEDGEWRDRRLPAEELPRWLAGLPPG